MSYFLSDKPLKAGEIVVLDGDEARHISLSRRLEIGETIELQGPDGKRFSAEIIDASRNTITLQAIEEIIPPPESPVYITVFQALIKEQPLDNIIQKTTELGIGRLALFYAKNSVGIFKDIDKKLARWKKISEEACKQSGRGRAMEIIYLSDNAELEQTISVTDATALLEPSAKTRFSTWKPNSQVKKIGILVGPEGGFTEDEVAEFSRLKNVTPISMGTSSPLGAGPRILRADTAAIASSAIAQALWGDL